MCLRHNRVGGMRFNNWPIDHILGFTSAIIERQHNALNGFLSTSRKPRRDHQRKRYGACQARGIGKVIVVSSVSVLIKALLLQALTMLQVLEAMLRTQSLMLYLQLQMARVSK